jgi:hypothetical protein
MQRRAAQRPYVTLRPLAHVMGSRPRGSIGPPPERGAEVYMVWSRHVSAPDPRLALIKAWVFFVPESWDPAEGGPDPTQRGPGPVPGVWSAPAEVQPVNAGVRHLPRGPDPPLIPLEDIVLPGHVATPEPSTWWGRVLFTVRLEIATRAPHLLIVVRVPLF